MRCWNSVPKFWNMSKSGNHLPVYINGNFYILLAFGVLTFPLQWLLAWMVSVAVHETGHLLSMKLCGIRAEALVISGFGARIRAQDLGKHEWLCALAGPIAGFTLLLFARWIPRVAVCALIHSIFNLLPVYPMDGGRFLRSVLLLFLPESAAVSISRLVSFMSLAILGILIFKMPDMLHDILNRKS